jgi:hypothetical protein
MEVPEKIPEDIDRLATDIVRADYTSSGDEPEWLLYKAIAQALLSERLAQKERDALIADEIDQPGVPGSSEWLAMGNFAGAIRDAIRNQP